MAKLQEFLKKFNNLVASVNFYLYLCAVTNKVKFTEADVDDLFSTFNDIKSRNS